MRTDEPQPPTYRWFIALGSNLGDGLENLRAARRHLTAFGQVQGASPIYESAPMYDLDQPRFYNAVLLLESTFDGPTLLQKMQAFESEHGRTRSSHRRYGPRAIDLDIVAGFEGTGAARIENERLQVPHPRMHERAFVLVPMRDVVAQWQHPTLHQGLDDLIEKAGVDDSLRIVFGPEQWA